MIEKEKVVAAALALFREELAGLEQTTRAARDEATSPESRPENKYDTRATEASYLAAGQGQRVLAIRRMVEFLQAESPVLSLFLLEGEAGELRFLLAPDGGGRRFRACGVEIVVVTAESPVGAALAASREGDAVQIGPPGARRGYEIVSIL